jgi:hypothetical protein
MYAKTKNYQGHSLSPKDGLGFRVLGTFEGHSPPKKGDVGNVG